MGSGYESARLGSPWSGRRVAGSGTRRATRGPRRAGRGDRAAAGAGTRASGPGFLSECPWPRSVSTVAQRSWVFRVPQVRGEGRSSPSPSGTGGRLATHPDRPFPGGTCSALEADGPSLLRGAAMPTARTARCSLRHGQGWNPVPLLLAGPCGLGLGPLDKGPSPTPFPWSAPLPHGTKPPAVARRRDSPPLSPLPSQTRLWASFPETFSWN